MFANVVVGISIISMGFGRWVDMYVLKFQIA